MCHVTVCRQRRNYGSLKPKGMCHFDFVEPPPVVRIVFLGPVLGPYPWRLFMWYHNIGDSKQVMEISCCRLNLLRLQNAQVWIMGCAGAAGLQDPLIFRKWSHDKPFFCVESHPRFWPFSMFVLQNHTLARFESCALVVSSSLCR